MDIAVIGLSHKTAPVEVREKLSLPETEIQNLARTSKWNLDLINAV